MTKFKDKEYRLVFRNEYEKDLFVRIKIKCAEEETSLKDKIIKMFEDDLNK